jgi:putative DNA primase/helicase
VADVAAFVGRYIVMPDEVLMVASAWTAAAWLSDVWDRFPHLAITSPEKRCGKTHLLQLLELVTPNAVNTSSISPAAIYRLIESRKPTLLLDEAQSLKRGGETADALNELLCAGIDRHAKVYRCSREGDNEVQSFSAYSPKVIALIGNLNGVLADRCLPLSLKRKTTERVEQYRTRTVVPLGQALREKLEKWATDKAAEVTKVYERVEPFDIANDRLAELLMPLQAVMEVVDVERLEVLRNYAQLLDAKDREAERMSPGVRILTACKEIFAQVKATENGVKYLRNRELITKLIERSEEPWAKFSRGEPITAEALANLLRPYGVKSVRSKDQKERWYLAHDFQDAWNRYTPENPA